MSSEVSPDYGSESSVTKQHEPIHKVDRGGHVVHDEPPAAASYPPDVKPPTWVGIRELMRDAFSEFLGTMVLILFGDGVVAQVTLSENTKGDYQSISWGWG